MQTLLLVAIVGFWLAAYSDAFRIVLGSSAAYVRFHAVVACLLAIFWGAWIWRFGTTWIPVLFFQLLMVLSWYVFQTAGRMLWRDLPSVRRSVEDWLVSAALLCVSVGLSWVLVTRFHWTTPSLPGELPLWGVIVPAVLSPLNEEIFLRQYLQGRLMKARWRFGLGVRLWVLIVPAVFFALMHTGSIEPVWIKWVQIFVLGLSLGVIRLRLGLAACIGAHVVFNLLMIWFSFLLGAK